MKVGLEIHQRLLWKLFCSCNSEYDDQEFSIIRMLNISKSETGDIDLAAKMELEKGKKYIYVGNRQSCCLVELDEEPPHLPNPKALEAAVSIANRLNMYIPKHIRFMRKIVVDGSNTSGFQRTAIIGMDGHIQINGKKYNIDTLCLEEESADILEDNENYKTYHLNRLGIALLEISTSPNITNGEEAKQVAQYIGLLLRLSGYVARGIGSIRQDLNISVDQGNRVEIKGAQELEMIPIWIENERKRQEDLLRLLPEIENIPIEEFNPIDVTSIIKNNPKLTKFFSNDKVALLLRYPGYKGIFGRKIGLRRYGSEIADYARMAGVKGIIHSDEADQYNLEDLAKYINSDGWLLVIDGYEKAIKALKYAYQRSLIKNIPAETRRALKDGSTQFMRPLPGAARMYPETDIPIISTPNPIEIPDVDQTIEMLSKELNRELANRIIWNKRFYLYNELKSSIDPKILAITLEDTVTSIRRELGKEPEDHHIRFVLDLYKNKKITKRAIKEVLKAVIQNQDYSHLYRFDQNKLRELLKSYSKEELMKKYPINIEYEDLQLLK